MFVTALVAVVVFASAASAVQYAYVSSDKATIGTIEVTTDGKLTLSTASKSFDMTGVRLCSAGENVLAVGTSSDKTKFVLLDKNLATLNSGDIDGKLDVSDVVVFNDKLLINASISTQMGNP